MKVSGQKPLLEEVPWFSLIVMARCMPLYLICVYRHRVQLNCLYTKRVKLNCLYTNRVIIFSVVFVHINVTYCIVYNHCSLR